MCCVRKATKKKSEIFSTQTSLTNPLEEIPFFSRKLFEGKSLDQTSSVIYLTLVLAIAIVKKDLKLNTNI
jgi:hypothetical protein